MQETPSLSFTMTLLKILYLSDRRQQGEM